MHDDKNQTESSTTSATADAAGSRNIQFSAKAVAQAQSAYRTQPIAPISERLALPGQREQVKGIFR
jgi:hypothetical protein